MVVTTSKHCQEKDSRERQMEEELRERQEDPRERQEELIQLIQDALLKLRGN